MTFTKKIAAHEEKLGKKKKREREEKCREGLFGFLITASPTLS
jgi:hypothetical protein